MSIEENYGCIPGSATPHMQYGHPHDWRLWERKWVSRLNPPHGENHGWQETWYCTRCRKIDERMGT